VFLESVVLVLTSPYHKDKAMMRERETKEKVAKVRELFAEIDVNGDGTMQWEELTEFLIEAGMVSREEMSVDAIKKYYPSSIQDNTRHDDVRGVIGHSYRWS